MGAKLRSPLCGENEFVAIMTRPGRHPENKICSSANRAFRETERRTPAQMRPGRSLEKAGGLKFAFFGPPIQPSPNL